MLDNKINNDFLKSRDSFGNRYNIVVSLSLDGLNDLNITDTVSDIKSIKYSMWNFATCELILNDKGKKVNRLYFLNSINIMRIKFLSPESNNELSFSGRIVEFKPIDFDKDIYYVKLYSQWNFFNITPNRVKISVSGEKIVTDVLKEIITYKITVNENNDDNFNLFQLMSADGGLFNCSKSADDIKLNNFIVPNWNITEILNYFSEMSITNDGYGFLWYEDVNGLYFYSVKDFENLFSSIQPTIFHFNKNQSLSLYKERENKNVKRSEDVDGGITNRNVIYDYEVLGFNIVELAKNNAGNQRRIIFDYTTKQVLEKYELSFNDYFTKHETINRSSLLGNDSMYAMGNRNPIEDREIDSQLYSSNGRNTNSITKSLFNNFQIKIKTNFLPEYSLGMKVYLEVPAIGDDGEYKYLNGQWLVIGIEHKYEVSSSYDNKPLATSILTLGRDSKEYSELDKLNKSITKTEKSITGV